MYQGTTLACAFPAGTSLAAETWSAGKSCRRGASPGLLVRGLEFLHILSSCGRLNQLGGAEFEVKGVEQRGLLGHFFA